MRDQPLVAARGQQSGLVDEVGKVGAGEPGVPRAMVLAFDIGASGTLRMCTEDFLTARDVGIRHHDLPVKTARTQQRRVQNVRTVGRRNQDDAFIGFKAVHLHQQLVERLLALVIAAAKARATGTAHGVDLVDEDDAGRVLLGLFEHVAHTAGADANEHFHKIRTGNGEEGHARFTGNGARQQRLTGARGPTSKAPRESCRPGAGTWRVLAGTRRSPQALPWLHQRRRHRQT
jgi:hypothetical protein